jgi:hypothetical protein
MRPGVNDEEHYDFGHPGVAATNLPAQVTGKKARNLVESFLGLRCG